MAYIMIYVPSDGTLAELVEVQQIEQLADQIASKEGKGGQVFAVAGERLAITVSGPSRRFLIDGPRTVPVGTEPSDPHMLPKCDNGFLT